MTSICGDNWTKLLTSLHFHVQILLCGRPRAVIPCDNLDCKCNCCHVFQCYSFLLSECVMHVWPMYSGIPLFRVQRSTSGHLLCFILPYCPREDLWPNLSKAGGQQAPEVIFPSPPSTQVPGACSDTPGSPSTGFKFSSPGLNKCFLHTISQPIK